MGAAGSRPFPPKSTFQGKVALPDHCLCSNPHKCLISFGCYPELRLGKWDIDKIQRDQVKQLVYGLLAQGKSRSTVKGILAPLSEMYNHAIDDGHVTTNPTRRILFVLFGKTQVSGGRKQTFSTREELGFLLRACQERYPEAYPWLSLLARTGMVRNAENTAYAC